MSVVWQEHTGNAEKHKKQLMADLEQRKKLKSNLLRAKLNNEVLQAVMRWPTLNSREKLPTWKGSYERRRRLKRMPIASYTLPIPPCGTSRALGGWPHL